MARKNTILYITLLILPIFSLYLFSDEKEQDKPALEQAIELSNEEEYNDAILKFKESIKKDSKNIEAHLNLGLVYFTIEEYEKALDEFLITIKLDSNKYIAYYFLGLIYESKFIEEKEIEKREKIREKAVTAWKNFVKFAPEEDKNKIQIAEKHIRILSKDSENNEN